jgi:hypothetical protein
MMQVPTISVSALGSSCQIWPSTRSQIRVNRLLAWGIVMSPMVQVVTSISFWRGLLFDVVLILVHGAWSLKLFGVPKTTKTAMDRDVLLVSGISPIAISPRNKLLLSGYRVLLGTIYLLGVVAALRVEQLLPWLGPVVLILGIYAMLRLPFSSLGHLYVASQSAAKRWGARGVSELIALMIVVIFMVVSLLNLMRI